VLPSLAALDEALRRLDGVSAAPSSARSATTTPADLVDECLALCAQGPAASPEPVRTVHHFACSGGTLICKCIAAMPNTQLLSEVDPLSPMTDSHPRFAPTDMLTLVRQSSRGASQKLILDLFMGDIALLLERTASVGQRLVLRDHAHSHFCTGAAVPVRPTLREIVAERFPVLSVVTVRHPLESFLSLRQNQWLYFSPKTFDEYCGRYLAFLQAHDGVPVIRYEDFVADPLPVMRQLCTQLEIPFSDRFPGLFNVFRMSGDSGRGGNVIESRPRRPLDEALAGEARESPRFRQLRALLGYDE
jgi:hypothetical protein